MSFAMIAEKRFAAAVMEIRGEIGTPEFIFWISPFDH